MSERRQLDLGALAARYVGLAGRAGSGKNFLAREWPKAYRFYAEELSFGNRIRQDIEHALGDIDIPALWAKPTSHDVRRLLQWWGTDYRKEEQQNPDIWVDQAIALAGEMEMSFSPLDVIFFTDVRNANDPQLGIEDVCSHGAHSYDSFTEHCARLLGINLVIERPWDVISEVSSPIRTFVDLLQVDIVPFLQSLYCFQI